MSEKTNTITKKSISFSIAKIMENGPPVKTRHYVSPSKPQCQTPAGWPYPSSGPMGLYGNMANSAALFCNPALVWMSHLMQPQPTADFRRQQSVVSRTGEVSPTSSSSTEPRRTVKIARKRNEQSAERNSVKRAREGVKECQVRWRTRVPQVG